MDGTAEVPAERIDLELRLRRARDWLIFCRSPVTLDLVPADAAALSAAIEAVAQRERGGSQPVCTCRVVVVPRAGAHGYATAEADPDCPIHSRAHA